MTILTSNYREVGKGGAGRGIGRGASIGGKRGGYTGSAYTRSSPWGHFGIETGGIETCSREDSRFPVIGGGFDHLASGV